MYNLTVQICTLTHVNTYTENKEFKNSQLRKQSEENIQHIQHSVVAQVIALGISSVTTLLALWILHTET